MCGRYASFLCRSRRPAVPYRQPAAQLPTDLNMAPTQDAMVVRHHPETGERHLDLLKWGLLPYFTKDPVHREAADQRTRRDRATSGMFKSAFARRRCIVPADAFYEWKPVEGGSSRMLSHAWTVSQWRSPGCGKGSIGQTAR